MGLVLLAARCVIAAVFFRAGLAKVTDLADFRSAVANYQLLPQALVPAVASSLPFLEIAGAAALALGIAAGTVAAALALLLLAFSAAVTVNLARGRIIDCGCAGSAPRTISWRHVLANLALAVAAGTIAVAPPATLAIWPGPPGLVTVATPTGAALPVLLAVLLVLVLLAAARRAIAVRRLSATVAGQLPPSESVPVFRRY